MTTFEIQVGDETLVVIVTSAAWCEDPRLTPAEREIAMDVAIGLSNAAIAARRGSSIRTVANQLAATYRKLGLASRSELATYVLGR